MSAGTSVTQLIRAHFQRNDAAFVGAAMALARGAKSGLVRNAIIELCRKGYAQRPEQGAAFQPLPAPMAASGLLQPLPPIGFADLMLDSRLQLFIDEIVTELEYRDELGARKLRPRSRLLFHGVPGNGKTSVASAIAAQLGVPAYAVQLNRVVDKYVGGTGQNIGAIFDSIGPSTLVVFDELDAIGSNRGTVEQAAGKEMNGIVNTMLTLMDRNKNGIIIGTTNRLDIVDPALVRRFDETILFPAPSIEQMTALAQQLCDRHSVPLVDVSGCTNYDAVTKTVEREARRIVMREILAAEGTESDDSDEQSEAEDDPPLQ